MGYFDNITFLAAGDEAECTERRVLEEPPYALHFALSGRLDLAIGGAEPKRLTGPVAFWCCPGNRYEFGPTCKAGWHHIWVRFAGPGGRRVVEDGLVALSADGYLPVRVPGLFAECFGRLVELVVAADPRRQPERVMALQRLLAILWKDWYCEQSGTRHKEMEALIGEICARPRESYDFRQVAQERFHVSYRHFQRIFKEHADSSPYDFLLQSRMRWAARRLVEDDLPIGTVARQVGYQVPGEFSRMFKRKMGMSPQQFREFGLGA